MPPYAGFASLREYLEDRCSAQHISFNELSENLGVAHTYIATIAAGRFVPSRRRADAIADYFGDDRRLVRVLAGLELVPREEDRTLAAIQDVAASLSDSEKKDLLKYAQFLKARPK